MSIGQQRELSIGKLTGDLLDVLIIGGGIVGSGLARDAAMRGLKVGLVEQHDFASGTSSRSSRLLHGGLRYLAQGRIGLVREASIEKKVIHRIAPHLAEPLPFIFPAYRDHNDWKLWKLKIGVKLYDFLCSGQNLGKSKGMDVAEVLQRVPTLNSNGLHGAVRYYDAFTNDARLTIDTLRSAFNAGAMPVNYCQFIKAKYTHLWECELNDLQAERKLKVRARTVINATGAWAANLQHSRVKLRLTKGIHLVIDQTRIPVKETVVLTEGKRILFAIPWGDKVILGTTDTDYNGSLNTITANEDDVKYVLRIINQFFPTIKLISEDIISVWAGVRPLVATDNGNTSEISRSHKIINVEPGWWDVAGGKLTTYRLMAQQTIDQVVRWLARSQALNKNLVPCRTAEEPLLSENPSNFSGVLPPKFTSCAVEHYCNHEWAVHLDDVMVRRTSWHHYYRDAADKARLTANWMGALLGWSLERRNAELDRYHAMTTCHVIKMTTPSGSTQLRNDLQTLPMA